MVLEGEKCICREGFIPDLQSSCSLLKIGYPGLFFTNNKSLAECLPGCIRCSSLEVCLDCMDTYYLSNDDSCRKCSANCKMCTSSACQ